MRRCHNHKFDPILQRDYYAMQAVFAGLSYGDRRWRGEEDDRWTASLPAVSEKVETARASLQSLRTKHQLLSPLLDRHTESFEPTAAQAIRMTIDATNTNAAASLYELEAWTTPSGEGDTRNVALASSGARPSASSFALANQTRHFDNLVDGSVDRRQAFPWVAKTGGPAWVQVDFAETATIDRITWERGSSVPVDYKIEVLSSNDEWTTVAETKRRMPRVDDVRKAEQVTIAGLGSDEVKGIIQAGARLRNAQRELSRLSAGPQVYAAKFTNSPEQTWLLRRGDPMQRTEPVEPAIPLVLGKMDYAPHQAEVQRRVAFGQTPDRSQASLDCSRGRQSCLATSFWSGIGGQPLGLWQDGIATLASAVVGFPGKRLCCRRLVVEEIAPHDCHVTDVSAIESTSSGMPCRRCGRQAAVAFSSAPSGGRSDP